MRRNLFLSLCLLSGSMTATAQLSIGVQAGAVFSRPNSSYEIDATLPITVEATGMTRYSAGLVADMPIGEGGFRLMPELNYVSKAGRGSTQIGISLPTGPAQIGIDITSTINYLELPFNVAYSAPVGDHFFVIGAGPYVAMGLNGKTVAKFSDDIGISDQEEPIVFGSVGNEVKRWDYGANLMAGFIHRSGLMLKGNYSLGMQNLSNDGNPEFKNRYFGLSIVYFFLKAGR